MLVGVCGFIGSGKGTVTDILIKGYGFRTDSFAKPVKDCCASIFGWDRKMLEGDSVESRQWRDMVDVWWANKLGIPGFTPRYAMQHFGTNVMRDHFNQNIWLNSLDHRFHKNPHVPTVISDARFKNEIDYITGNRGILIHVNRGKQPVWYDTAVKAYSDPVYEKDMHINYPNVHQSEWAWVGSTPTYIIDNNGTYEDLVEEVENLVQHILG